MGDYFDHEKLFYRRISEQSRKNWLLREAKLAHGAREQATAEAGLLAKESLPVARVPEFEDDEDVPVTPQGRALRAMRRSRVTP